MKFPLSLASDIKPTVKSFLLRFQPSGSKRESCRRQKRRESHGFCFLLFFFIIIHATLVARDFPDSAYESSGDARRLA